MAFDILLLVAGLGLLFFGGEALVSGAVSTAKRFCLPPFLIGLTIVGFGTSMPELMVSLEAVAIGAPDIALGNVVGSNIANILLILGVAAVIAPLAMTERGVGRDIVAMLIAALALTALGLTGGIGRWAGGGMVLLLIGYIAYAARVGWGGKDDAPEPAEAGLGGWTAAGAMVLGLVMLMWGADLLISSATSIARSLGVSEAVIGLTVIAVGTSLPELATSVMAAVRRQSDIALGNVVGSNIFNVACILGLTAMVEPVPIAQGFARFDIPIMLVVSGVLALAFFRLHRLSRLAGVTFLIAYAAYVTFLM